ncbi:multisubunit potassium/proton antiporter, PhaD subunit (TC 2.A.63.1.1) [Modicisalibacter muralis]|uniref:Multisubunit potassium/proton antiporter, PhaD subunit (TC 2.A.63.1.1) n=2 Tax=Modicisalibacter muralis TaxID=119000 RepID=A0A1G9IU25_9GAMM|nr:multisubunit potassium/proton antiporter, PhaD subunit (TC 2.A.63.1.1) [Halomonas muralis]
MNHLIVMPILVPLIAGLALLLNRDGSATPRRIVGLTATALLVAVCAMLVFQSTDDTIRYYALGDWQPPFGIILVLDRLSAMMVMLTAVLAFGSLLFASAGGDEEGSNFQGLFQLQLMGINGAFLTGDLFNLFVFFEVLLIASYSLLMHGGGKARIHSGFHYVALNLAGSALFLIGVGVLYGALGTLNMADMAARVAELDGDRRVLVEAGALLLLVVFALKAAMLPLYFWLPRAYASAPAPVAALFAIMTKVGVYAIIRVFTLIFGPQAGSLAGLAQPWVWWLALATLALGGVGVLSARDLRTQAAYLIVLSVGTLLAGVGMNSTAANAALLYYLMHTTLVTGGLFLLAETISIQRGKAGARIVRGRAVHQIALLGGLFLLAAMTVAGVPPFSGAIGKALLLQSASPAQQPWLWPILLISSLAAIVALSRTGSTLFWRASSSEKNTDKHEKNPEREQADKGEKPEKGRKEAVSAGPLRIAGLLVLLGASPVLMLFAGPLTEFTHATAEQLADHEAYIQAILVRDSMGDGS